MAKWLTREPSVTFTERTEFASRAKHVFYFYQKPVRPSPLLPAVGRWAAAIAPSEAIERKAIIKRALAARGKETEQGSDDKAKVRAEAVATILFEMRETLALSRRTIIVQSTKQDNTYPGAVQLVPLHIVGTTSRIDAARDFLCRNALYLSEAPENHVSALFGTAATGSGASDDIGDLAIEVTAIDEPPCSHERTARLQVVRSIDGHPSYVRLEIDRQVLIDYLDHLEQVFEEWLREHKQERNSFVTRVAAALAAAGVYRGWDAEGYWRFYVETTAAQIRPAVQQVVPDLHTLLERFLVCTRNHARGLEQSISSEFKRSAPLLAANQQTTLVSALCNSIRLAMFGWREGDDRLGWRSCLYVMRKTAKSLGTGASGVSVLLLLSESDCATWRSPATLGAMPHIIGAIEPFLSAIVEIENTFLAHRTGELAQQYNFAHDAKGMIGTLLVDPNIESLTPLGQDMVRLLNLEVTLWSSVKSQPSLTSSPLNLRECAELARRLAAMHLEAKLNEAKPPITVVGSTLLPISQTDGITRKVKQYIRTTINDPERRVAGFFSNASRYGFLRGVVRTRWRNLLESILIRALRQSLSHAAICDGALGDTQIASDVLGQHSEEVCALSGGGIQCIIRDECLAPFIPEQTTEGRSIRMLLASTLDCPERLTVSWKVVPTVNGTFESKLAIIDPTAMMVT